MGFILTIFFSFYTAAPQKRSNFCTTLYNDIQTRDKTAVLVHTPWSIIFWKCTLTVQLLTFGWLSLEWINTLIFFDLILDARYPNTNSIESITLDLPLPFGPTIDEKFYNNTDTHINRWRNATTNGQVHFLHSLFLLLTVIIHCES